jgi:hypothetical protein
MPVTRDWIDPHILQVTYQGRLTLEEVQSEWTAAVADYERLQPKPFCLLSILLPDRQLPTGMLSLVSHPALKYRRVLDASALVGADHYLLKLLTESISKLHLGPQVKSFDQHQEALKFLQQFVRARQLNLD